MKGLAIDPPKKSTISCGKVLALMIFIAGTILIAVNWNRPIAIVHHDHHEDHFTAMGIMHGRNHTFAWRQIYDRHSNRFRIDVMEVKGHEHQSLETQQSIFEQAVDLLEREKVDANQNIHFGTPMTGIFTPDGIYGIYKDGDGNAACRSYKNPHPKLPKMNLLDGAKDLGLVYLGPHLSEHFTELNIPGHSKLNSKLGLKESHLWVEPFTKHPMKARFIGSVEKNGNHYDFDVSYHVFRFYTFVNEAELRVPKSILDLCHPVDLVMMEMFAPFV